MIVLSAFRRVHHRITNLSLAASLGIGAAAVGAWALLPVVPTLLNEKSFASQLEEIARESKLSQMTDTEIRSRVQQRAREVGFHIEFEDIFVEYLRSPQGGSVPLPSKLGYTLRLELPLFGFIEWPLVALRTYPVGERSDDER